MDGGEYFSIPNLTSQDVTVVLEPWSSGDASAPREGIKGKADHPSYNKEKAKWMKWCKSNKTNHSFISLCASENIYCRCSKEFPAHVMNGFIVDYDGHDFKFDGKNLRFQPTFISRSNNGVHLIYEFETPLYFAGVDFYSKFMYRIMNEMNFKANGVGFDEGAFLDSTRYYEVGFDWIDGPEDAGIPANTVQAWYGETCKQIKKWDPDAPKVPIEFVRDKLSAKYPDPGFDWDEFEVGFRCHRFWDPSAKQLAVKVTEDGMRSWTGDEPFKKWVDRELVGPSAIREQGAVRIANAIEDFAMVGKDDYHWHNGAWSKIKNEDLKRNLYVSHGLDKASQKGEPSEVDQALNQILLTKRATALRPQIFDPSPKFRHEGKTYLNSGAHVKPLKPHPDPHHEWGEGWENIRKILEEMFPDDHQLELILSFLKYCYCNALASKPRSALFLILFGEPSAGKNFFINAILGQLMGGYAGAGKFLLNNDQFNENLVLKPVWTLHDPAPKATHSGAMSAFRETMKEIIANEEITERGMHRAGEVIERRNILAMTINDDSKALGMIPAIAGSVKSKVLGLKCSGVLKWNGTRKNIPKDPDVIPELIHFAAYLRDMEVPEEYTEPRFGVPAFMHEDIIGTTLEASVYGNRASYLRMVFDHGGFDGKSWEGKALDLIQYLKDDDRFKYDIDKNLGTGNALGMTLGIFKKDPITWEKYGIRVTQPRDRHWLIEFI